MKTETQAVTKTENVQLEGCALENHLFNEMILNNSNVQLSSTPLNLARDRAATFPDPHVNLIVWGVSTLEHEEYAIQKWKSKELERDALGGGVTLRRFVSKYGHNTWAISNPNGNEDVILRFNFSELETRRDDLEDCAGLYPLSQEIIIQTLEESSEVQRHFCGGFLWIYKAKRYGQIVWIATTHNVDEVSFCWIVNDESIH